MSENKRFEIKEFPHDAFLKRRIYDNSTGEIYDCTLHHQDLLCDLLNQQNDEIKQLKQEKERNKKAERMKIKIRLIIVLIALGLILWGIFFPVVKEYVIQQILGIMCVGIALGMSIGRS